MKNLRIGTRLAIGFGAVLLFMTFMTGMGIWRLHKVNEAITEVTLTNLAKERYIADWFRSIFSGVSRTTAVAKSNDPSLGAFFAKDTAASTKYAAEQVKKIEPLLNSAEEKTLWVGIQEKRKLFISSRDQVLKAKAEGNLEEANRVLEQVYLPGSASYVESVQKLLDLQREAIDTRVTEISAIEEQSRMLLIALGILVLMLGSGFAWWLTAGITRPLGKAVSVAQTVTSGDLTSRIEVDSNDETGLLLQALKDMNDSLVKIVSEVRTGTESISTASGEIASGNLDLSSRTEQQASSLEETASSMEELTSTVKQNADNARQANGLAASASEVAVKGGAVVSQVVDTMGSINESAKKIVDIIGVIDGIAFQTNILALNAAVEAARAGEQGRGFAVVASEVRNLAQRSAAAAKEIKTLIGDSVVKVDTGTKLVDQAGATMDEIVSSVKRVTDIMGEITAASQEQTAGIEQVNQAISQMDEATQQNASLVEEAAAASQSMQVQAAKLAQVVSVFKLSEVQAAAPAPVLREPHLPQAKLSPVVRASIAPSRLQRIGNVQHAKADEREQF
jgi:methyl-accepting chemotaxis protein